MEKRLTIIAEIDSKGALLINSEGKRIMSIFQMAHKKKKLLIHLEIFEAGSSDTLIGYYFKVVVQRIQGALKEIGDHKSDAQVDYWLRTLSPVTSKLDHITYGTNFTNVKDLPTSDLLEHIDFCCKLAAEHLHIEIKNGREI